MKAIEEHTTQMRLTPTRTVSTLAHLPGAIPGRDSRARVLRGGPHDFSQVHFGVGIVHRGRGLVDGCRVVLRKADVPEPACTQATYCMGL